MPRAPAPFHRWQFASVMLLLTTSACPAPAQQPSRNLVPLPGASTVVTLSQNWMDDEARWFYNVPQGSKLVPYSWFLHLEQPDNQQPFLDPAHIQSLGYLARSKDKRGNPDGLPVGFVKDGDHLGLTCAACHTAAIRMRNKAWLIDGAPAGADFERLLRRLTLALKQTTADPARFDRFAGLVLGPMATPDAKTALMKDLTVVGAFRDAYNGRNLPHANAPPFGPARVDAFGAIMNEVATTFAQVQGNDAPADAPVRYPCLWDTPQHDKVQWNGAASNTDIPLLAPLIHTPHVGALGRNVGEVLGVFGTLDASTAGVTGLKGYPASANRTNLIDIEETLRKLWSPQWPAEFGAVDKDDWIKGAALFKDNCARCHDDRFDRTAPSRTVEAILDAVGTDPAMARNFATRHAKTGVLKGRLIALPGLRRFDSDSAVKDMLVHFVQRAILGPDPLSFSATALAGTAPKYDVHAEIRLGDNRRLAGAFSSLDLATAGKVRMVRSRGSLVLKQAGKLLVQDAAAVDQAGHFFDLLGKETPFDLTKDAHAIVRAFVGGTQVEFEQPVAVDFAYKARPLNGVWAMAPYLHNGSVPNLDELLKPPAERVKKFRVGSREYDPVKVGFQDAGDFVFDTTQPGNSNAGHDYGRVFSDVERRQLIAYVKAL